MGADDGGIFTVIVTVNVDPIQLPGAVGVTVYVAVCAVIVVLVSVPYIFAELLPGAPFEKPVPDGAAQL